MMCKIRTPESGQERISVLTHDS